jgi:hypothetical protein
MADIEFQEERGYVSARSDQPSFFTRIVLATGMVRTERGAQYVLLALTALIIFATFMFQASKSKDERTPSRAVHAAANP